MHVSEFAGGSARAGSVAALSIVTLAKAVETKQGIVPAGATGTVVHAHGDGRDTMIEFYEPFHAVATVEADAIAG